MASSKRVALQTASAIWSSVTRNGAPFGFLKSIAGNRCASLAFLADCSVDFRFLSPCPQRRPPLAPPCRRPPFRPELLRIMGKGKHDPERARMPQICNMFWLTCDTCPIEADRPAPGADAHRRSEGLPRSCGDAEQKGYGMKQLSWVVAAAAALAIATPVRAQAAANTTPAPPQSTIPPSAYSGPSPYGTTRADPPRPSNPDGGGSAKRRMPQGGKAISN